MSSRYVSCAHCIASGRSAKQSWQWANKAGARCTICWSPWSPEILREIAASKKGGRQRFPYYSDNSSSGQDAPPRAGVLEQFRQLKQSGISIPGIAFDLLPDSIPTATETLTQPPPDETPEAAGNTIKQQLNNTLDLRHRSRSKLLAIKCNIQQHEEKVQELRTAATEEYNKCMALQSQPSTLSEEYIVAINRQFAQPLESPPAPAPEPLVSKTSG